MAFIKEKECIFCKIIRGESSAYTIDESSRSICILDINPLQRGHCLVIPKRHIRYWFEMDEEETADLYNLARRVAMVLMRVYRADFITQYARGRRIPHTHIFLVPTFSKDPVDRYFNALEGFQEGARYLSSLASKGELRRIRQEIVRQKGMAKKRMG